MPEVPAWMSENPFQQSTFVPRAAVAEDDNQASEATADGTWRDDGRHVIINLGGRELKLVKAKPQRGSESRSVAEPFGRGRNRGRGVSIADFAPGETGHDDGKDNSSSGGSVLGELLHRGRPLVNCKVSLIPLKKSGYKSYSVDGSSKPQSTTTDDRGEYFFENVPPGPYKLFWMPKGTRRWIHRIEYKPEVIVRQGERANIKTVRRSLRTLNR